MEAGGGKSEEEEEDGCRRRSLLLRNLNKYEYRNTLSLPAFFRRDTADGGGSIENSQGKFGLATAAAAARRRRRRSDDRSIQKQVLRVGGLYRCCTAGLCGGGGGLGEGADVSIGTAAAAAAGASRS